LQLPAPSGNLTAKMFWPPAYRWTLGVEMTTGPLGQRMVTRGGETLTGRGDSQ
jgi:transketolase